MPTGSGMEDVIDQASEAVIAVMSEALDCEFQGLDSTIGGFFEEEVEANEAAKKDNEDLEAKKSNLAAEIAEIKKQKGDSLSKCITKPI